MDHRLYTIHGGSMSLISTDHVAESDDIHSEVNDVESVYISQFHGVPIVLSVTSHCSSKGLTDFSIRASAPCKVILSPHLHSCDRVASFGT